MKCTLNWNDKSLVKKMVHLPGRIISKWFRNSQIADRLRNQIQDHLLNEVFFCIETCIFCECYVERKKFF